MSGGAGALGVLVDGEAMPADEARAFWARFSAHMEENKGDLAGFAKKEGFASVHPSMKNGAPVLVASRSAAQGPYVSVSRGDDGKGDGKSGAKKGPGSPDHRATPHDPRTSGGARPKGSKRRRGGR